jgi:hypothetical protein
LNARVILVQIEFLRREQAPAIHYGGSICKSADFLFAFEQTGSLYFRFLLTLG